MKFPLTHAKKYGLMLLVGVALILAAEGLGFFEGINSYSYDLFFRLRGPAGPDERILIAAVDERTLDRLGRWPIRRVHYARLLDHLPAAGAVGFDIMMAEPTEDDASLGRAIRKHGRVVLPAYVEGPSRIASSVPLLAPHRTGHAHLEQGVDGIVRTVYHTLYTGDQTLPSLSSVIHETLTGLPFPRETAGVRTGDRRTRYGIAQRDLRKINFYGPPGTVSLISLIDILDGVYPDDFFAGKIILVGVTAAGLESGLLTPFSQQRDRMTGVESHAQVLSNIIDQNSIVDIPPPLRWFFSLGAAFLGFLLFLRVGVRRAALLWGLGLVAAILFSFLLFATVHRWFSPALFAFSISFLFLVSYIFKLEAAGTRLGEAKKDWEESFNAINDAIVLMDRDGRTLRTNEAAGSLINPMLRDLLVGRCARMRELSGNAATGIPDTGSGADEGNATGDLYERDTDRHFDVKSFPRLDGQGRFIGVVHVVRDITERKRAEATAAREKIFANTVIDCLPGIFFICDEAGKLVRWNDNEKAMTGFSPRELAELNIMRLFQCDRGLIMKKMNEVLTTGRADLEAPVLTKSGVAVSFYLNWARMLINRTWYIVGVGIDISERKRLEQQLLQSQKMESIGQLAGGVAHDFNNILSAIIGYGSVLQMKMAATDPLRVNVDHMLESAQRAAQLTYSLLAFSRKQVIHVRPTSLGGIMARQEKFLRRIIGEDIELKTVIRDDTTIMADGGQIEQVLMNLSTNARDAMPKGGTLLIETELQEMKEPFSSAHGVGEPGPYAVISVTDSGSGMDEKTMQKLFEPFFTTKEVGRGTGLGLAIVYEIIKQHQGHITVTSRVGEGTTFKIYLPAYAGQVESRTAVVVEPPVVTGTETLLLAEDDAILRRFFRDILTEYGYTVVLAEDGEDAIRKYKEHRDKVQICLIDMIMPKKGGKDVYDAIQKVKPGTKVIFLSGYTADRVKQQDLPPECAFIMKPASPQVVLSEIRRVLDQDKEKRSGERAG